jgi:hypothetical protein
VAAAAAADEAARVAAEAAAAEEEATAAATAAAAAAAGVDEYGVPRARSPVPLDGWNALDHLSVWDCYLGMCKQSKDIPRAFHGPWAQALAEVLIRVETAVSDADPLVLERAVKWFFILHQLLLRLDAGARVGRRLEEAMARRFELWQQGDYRELVASWSRDRMAAALKEDRDMDRAAAIRQAIALIEDGCLSKAMAHLGEHGLGDLGLPAIQAQLQRKHPQERREWDRERPEGSPRLVPGDARKALINMKRKPGVGADRFRAEYLLSLVRGEMDAGVRGSVLGAWQVFSERVVNDDLPSWFYLVWTTVVQFAPIKAEGERPEDHEVRPVGCGGICRRAIMVQVKMAQKATLQAKCEPIQLGQGTSGGTQAFGIGFKMHMEHFPRHVLVPCDILNAFNEYERAQVIELCRTDPELRHLLGLFDSELRPRSHIYALMKGKLTLLGYRSCQGGQQGATTAVIGCNLITLKHFTEVNNAVAGNGGCARAIMDDLAVAGDPADVWPALQRLEDRLRAEAGLVLNRRKCLVYSPSGEYGDRPDSFKIGKTAGEIQGWR